MSTAPIALQSRVVALAFGLRQKILTGDLVLGGSMPSVRELARSAGVSTFTASRAYDLLVAEGLVDARRGAGYYVTQRVTTFDSGVNVVPEGGADSIWALRRTVDTRDIRVDAGCGWLPADWLSTASISTALQNIARRPAAYMGRYGNPYGLRTLRRHLVSRLAEREIYCNEEQIVTTQGASQALELGISILARRGETVLVDDPCYPYVLAMLRTSGMRAVGIPRTAYGPDAQKLHAVATSTGARVFITNTNLHNPTGTTTSLQVAQGLLKVARLHGITILEDDIFAELTSDGHTSLASPDQLNNVVYVGSFSKTIAPNIRVGFIVSSGKVPEQLAALKNVTSLSSSELAEQIALSILLHGEHDSNLEVLRGRLARNYERVARRLTALGAELSLGSGIFLWAKLPTRLNAAEVLQRAKTNGIFLAPGALFRPNAEACDYFRFNVAYSDNELLYQFVEGLPR
jgi:DNA-binding transcriptional MocR family regulator